MMKVSAVALLFLMAGSSLGQSGDSHDSGDDEDPDFECFSKIRMGEIKLICTVSRRPFDSTDNVYFNICAKNKCEKHKEGEDLKIEGGVYERTVCMMWGTRQYCREYNIFKIAIPDPPSLSIYYNNQSEEYIFDIIIPYTRNEYLKDRLIHEAVVRKEDAEWPVCENQTIHHGVHKTCFQNDNIRIPKRNLQYSTKYEARVRSKPNGIYYDGFWSQWSETTYLMTEPNELTENLVGELSLSGEEDLLIVILCCCAVAFILIVVITLTKLFWKDRIKPFIWPEMPDHKSALEKLCISPTKYIQISFNPDFFDNYHINKVDYMKAQVRTEDNLHVSVADTQPEKQLDIDGCNNTSSPAEGSKKYSALIGHTGQNREPKDHMAGTETLEINSVEEPTKPENVLLPTSDGSSKCITSNDSPAPPGAGPENFPAYSSAVKQPNNGLGRLCWEDISMYIAMSAFKTPNSAIKQSINI